MMHSPPSTEQHLWAHSVYRRTRKVPSLDIHGRRKVYGQAPVVLSCFSFGWPLLTCLDQLGATRGSDRAGVRPRRRGGKQRSDRQIGRFLKALPLPSPPLPSSSPRRLLPLLLVTSPSRSSLTQAGRQAAHARAHTRTLGLSSLQLGQRARAPASARVTRGGLFLSSVWGCAWPRLPLCCCVSSGHSYSMSAKLDSFVIVR